MNKGAFGMVVSLEGAPDQRIMLIVQSDGTVRTTDHFKQRVPVGDWLGVALNDDPGSASHEQSPFGAAGETTWVFTNKKWTQHE